MVEIIFFKSHRVSTRTISGLQTLSLERSERFEMTSGSENNQRESHLTSANNVRQVCLYGLMRNIAVLQSEHLAVYERHRLVVAHQHATLTSGPVHVPGTPPRATGVASKPLGLGRYDEVALRRVIDLSLLHELSQRVVNELSTGPLHGWEGVPQG